MFKIQRVRDLELLKKKPYYGTTFFSPLVNLLIPLSVSDFRHQFIDCHNSCYAENMIRTHSIFDTFLISLCQ
jgi:hypothetical protein